MYDWETTGVWKRKKIISGLISKWFELETYEPSIFDVRFHYGDDFNYNKIHVIDEWKTQFNLKDFFEIVEVFHEPINDVNPSFKGRNYLIARFSNNNDAIHFKLHLDFKSLSD